ncbi:MAG: hypothetical protein SGI88_12375 [Candidatus Hydrogenedentes bacterium]|nr:hypothetical protein [Candidatus Hydrogenedentota bacterium]
MATAPAIEKHRPWMVYGANGYTGRLCAIESVQRGMRPVLGGRNATALGELARELGLEFRVFTLDDPRVVADNLGGITSVLHCAGPFSATSVPMLSACEHAHCHYFDITGEIDVFEYVHSRDAHWKRSGMVAMPGVGFDVVPSDCLAAMLKRALPDATRLRLAFQSRDGKFSPGTAKTVVEGLPKGSRIRKEGKLISVPSASMTAMIPFRNSPELAVGIPWGDVSTAYYSTGIPNIEVYTGVPEKQFKMMRRAAALRPILGLGFVQRFLKNRITKHVKGPTESDRARNETLLWGEVTNDAGQKKALRMRTPEGYALTVDAAVTILQRVARTPLPPGALTPSMAFGPDFVLELQGVQVFEAE